MKKSLLFSFVISLTFLLTSYKIVVNKINAEVLSVLGFSKSTADGHIFNSVLMGSGYFARPENMAQFILKSGDEKTKITKDLCGYIKSYVYSQEFKDKYEAYRQSKKPDVHPLSEEEKANAEEVLSQMEQLYTPEMLDMLPPENENGGVLKQLKTRKSD